MTGSSGANFVASAPREPGFSKRAGVLLMIGLMAAAVMDALVSGILTYGRLDMLGDTVATADEFVGVDIGYTAAKLIAFLATPWLMGAFGARRTLLTAISVMVLSCVSAALTFDILTLTGLRCLQGLAGGVCLVGGQAVLLRAFAPPRQPMIQALFAIAAVVVPGTLVGSFQGWLVDTYTWTLIFLSAIPLGLLSIAALMRAGDLPALGSPFIRFSGVSFSLYAVAVVCLTFVLNRGNRWDWFETDLIVWLTLVGVAALVAFLVSLYLAARKGKATVLDLSIFRNNDFTFAFCVSFVAGAALLGSSYLIAAFAVSIQGITPTATGFMLVPGGLVFIVTLGACAALFTHTKAPYFLLVPFGIGLFMGSMFMLSFNGAQSGTPDMMLPLIVRGVGLGGLFLAINLVAYMGLKSPGIVSAVALFSIGRQSGGLMGVGWLETLVDRQSALNRSVLSASVTDGSPLLADRLEALSRSLIASGMDVGEAAKAAFGLLYREIARQASVIAFDTAFFSLGLMFCFAVPTLVSIKVMLGIRAARANAGQPDPDTPTLVTPGPIRRERPAPVGSA